MDIASRQSAVLLGCLLTLSLSVTPAAFSETILFEETFEDTAYSSRGWYDFNEPFITTSIHHVDSSSHSAEFQWIRPGDTTPRHRGARAHLDPVEGFTLSFYIKFSDNWEWTGRGYHPHFILFLTNKDGDYTGPAYTYLTLYVEPVDGYPLFGLQDSKNIDVDNIKKDLVGITENRAVESSPKSSVKLV